MCFIIRTNVYFISKLVINCYIITCIFIIDFFFLLSTKQMYNTILLETVVFRHTTIQGSLIWEKDTRMFHSWWHNYCLGHVSNYMVKSLLTDHVIS